MHDRHLTFAALTLRSAPAIARGQKNKAGPALDRTGPSASTTLLTVRSRPSGRER